MVLAAEGYPANPRTGDRIDGLDAAAEIEGVAIFHAGTRCEGDDIVTAGGRVLGVSALGSTIASARERAYEAVDLIHWRGMHHRLDIAQAASHSAGGPG